MAEYPVTAVIVHYQTPDLLRVAVSSLCRLYPGLPLLLIDNNSKDESASVIAALCDSFPGAIRVLRNAANLHHGPAMDQALRELTSRYVFFLDSDCEVLQGGLIERMEELLRDRPHNYAVGQKVFMNGRGFDVADAAPGATAYIRPVCMMLARDLYHTLPSFQLHGTPCLRNMTEAVRSGYGLIDFPVSLYVAHKGRGTAGRYGYALGLRGKINFILHKLGL